MQFLSAGEIHKGLIQRQRLDGGGELVHQRADLFANLGIGRHAGVDDDRVGAEVERFEHRHCRAHAANARHITGGRDNPALAAANDHRLVDQFRVVSFLDTGIKGIAIHMRDGEIKQLIVAHDSEAAAFGAAPGVGKFRQAIATKGRHGFFDFRDPEHSI